MKRKILEIEKQLRTFDFDKVYSLTDKTINGNLQEGVLRYKLYFYFHKFNYKYSFNYFSLSFSSFHFSQINLSSTSQTL